MLSKPEDKLKLQNDIDRTMRTSNLVQKIECHHDKIKYFKNILRDRKLSINESRSLIDSMRIYYKHKKQLILELGEDENDEFYDIDDETNSESGILMRNANQICRAINSVEFSFLTKCYDYNR